MEQFANFEDTNCDNSVYNSEYCTKTIKGDRENPGKESVREFYGMKQQDGIRGVYVCGCPMKKKYENMIL